MVGRKTFGVLALATLLVLVFASAVLAINKRCDTIPCNGTSNKDKLSERQGNGVADRINGRGGNDTLLADRYGNDRDLVNGGSGNDVIHVDDGDTKDKVNGGSGDYDTCYVDSVSEVVGTTCEDMRIKGGGKREKERAIRRFT